MVASAFSDAQRTTAAHSRATQLLLQSHSISPGHFRESFIHCLNRILLIFSRDPPVERLIQFTANFCATNIDTTQKFCTHILHHYIKNLQAVVPAIRFRTLQLIATILKCLPCDVDIGDKTIGKLQDAIKKRATDRIPRVRAAAAGALCRLQFSGDVEEDEFTCLLVKMFTTDSSASVRKAAMNAVAVSKSTTPHLLRRLRDVNHDVRRSAYEIFAIKINPRDLRQEEISMILREGLKDRIKSVRDTCRSKLLIEGWMKRRCNGNVFELVDIIGCKDYETEVLNALKVIFESEEYSKLVECIDIDINHLKRDNVLILRGLSEARRGDGGVDKFIPTLLVYCDVLNYYAADEFASTHLLELCKCVDMSDEAGRKALGNTLRTSFLINDQISEKIIPSAVRALRRTMVDEEACARLLYDIVRHEILLTVINDQEDNLPSQYENIEDDEEQKYWQRRRALNIILEVLRIASPSIRSSGTNTLYMGFIEVGVLPSLLDIHLELRQKAMECLGLLCMLDKSGTEAHLKLPIFIKACKSDIAPIQKITLKILVDMLMLFDFSSDKPTTSAVISSASTSSTRQQSVRSSEVSQRKVNEISDEEDEDESSSEPTNMAEECLNIISMNLANHDEELRNIAVMGLARLLYIRKVVPNVKLLSRLLFLYHNPATEDDYKLRQCLSIFFPVFSAKSITNRLCLEDTFKRMCKKIIEAEGSVSKISVVQVAQFIIELTSALPAKIMEQQKQSETKSIGRPVDQIHERLAEMVLNEAMNMCNEDNIDNARLYGKILGSFKLSWTTMNEDALEMLRKLARVASSQTSDRQMKRTFSKIADRLHEELQKRPDEPEILQPTSEEE